MSVGRILLHKATRDLRRRRAQLIAVAVTVGCGLAMFSSTYDAYRNLETSYQRVYDNLSFGDLWVTGGDTAQVVDAARADAGVTAVATRIEADVPLGLADREVRGRVVSIPVGDQPDVNRLLLSAGSYPTDANTVVLEQHAADHFHLGVGDTVSVVIDGTPTEVRVGGVAASAEYLWLARSRNEAITVPDDFAVVFAPRPLAEQMAPDAPEQVVLTATGTAPVDRMRAAARSAGAIDVYGRADQASNATLQIDVSGFGEMAVLFPILFLTAAGLAVYVLLGRLVQLDRPVIGALTANGVDRHTIQRHYATHAFVAVFAGAVPGLILGSLLGGLMTGLYTSELDIPVTATSFRPLTPIIGLGFAFVTAALIAIVPARTASRVLPAEALRPPAPPPGSGRTFVERLLPFRLPTGGRVALRNLFRSPKRALGTAVGVIVAAVVVIASAGMGDSMNAALHRQSSLDRRDLTAVIAGTADGATVAGFAAIDGVAAAEPADLVNGRVAASGAAAGAEVQLFQRGTTMHRFDGPFDGGMVLSKTTADQIGAGVGDRVEVTAGTADGMVTVIGVLQEPLGGSNYLDLDTWQAIGGGAPRAVSMRVTDGVDPSVVRDRLQARSDVLAVVDHAALQQAVTDLLGLFNVFIAIMVGFGIVLAIALVFNAITVNVSERTTELATLRAAGVGRRRLHRWVLVETLLVVALALIPGLVLGGIVSGQFLTAIDTGVFHFDSVINATTWLWVAALVLGAAALAHLPAFRRLDRMDLAAVVRERQA